MICPLYDNVSLTIIDAGEVWWGAGYPGAENCRVRENKRQKKGKACIWKKIQNKNNALQQEKKTLEVFSNLNGNASDNIVRKIIILLKTCSYPWSRKLKVDCERVKGEKLLVMDADTQGLLYATKTRFMTCLCRLDVSSSDDANI